MTWVLNLRLAPRLLRMHILEAWSWKPGRDFWIHIFEVQSHEPRYASWEFDLMSSTGTRTLDILMRIPRAWSSKLGWDSQLGDLRCTSRMPQMCILRAQQGLDALDAHPENSILRSISTHASWELGKDWMLWMCIPRVRSQNLARTRMLDALDARHGSFVWKTPLLKWLHGKSWSASFATLIKMIPSYITFKLEIF